MDLHWYGYVMYFEDIQAPRSQFKRRDKFGLTRILPTNTECKKCHQQEWKNYSTPSQQKMITCVTRTLWKIAWRGSRVIYSNYHTRNMKPGYTSLLGTSCRPQRTVLQISGMLKFQLFASFYAMLWRWAAEPYITRQKWTPKGNFVKVQELPLKLIL